MEAEDSRLVFIPFDKAAIPPAGLIEHLNDRWWITHPERGVAFFKIDKRSAGSPLCNRDEQIVRRMLQHYPWAEVRHFPSVFRTINVHDYC